MATATMTDRRDFTELVRTHQAGVWRYLRFLGCDEPQADDLTQETFLTLFKKSFATANGRDPTPFEDCGPQATAAYLRTVARNLFLMSIRKSNRSPVVENLDLADEVWARATGEDGGNSYVEALAECVEALDGRARQVIQLRYRDDRSRAEIAASLEMTEDGIKTLLRRTREILRRCVEKKQKP